MSKLKITKEVLGEYLNSDSKINLAKWDELLGKWEDMDEGKYKEQERVTKTFFKNNPEHDVLEKVLIKVAILNDFYSTRIFNVFKVAKHIVKVNGDMDITKTLSSENTNADLIKKLAEIDLKGKEKNFFSFATKYCALHLDDTKDTYPIYDSYIYEMLRAFNDNYQNFGDLSNKKLRGDYTAFKGILESFRETYGLSKYSLRNIDKCLWQIGKKEADKQMEQEKKKKALSQNKS